MKHLFELHRIPAVLPGFAGVRALAELAVDHANVCVIDVPVDVVIRKIPVETFACVVRQAADRNNVGRAIKFDAVFE
jgi:hypothetical protein